MNAYFFFNTENSGVLWSYYHQYIALAEGLTEIGVNCYGSQNMYQTEVGSNYLIRYDKNFPLADIDLAFFSSFNYHKSKKDGDKYIIENIKIFSPDCKIIFIDEADGLRTPGFYKGAQMCDIVLKSHYNCKYRYPKNFRAWQFGITNRIIDAVNPQEFKLRKDNFLVNFRPKHILRSLVNALIKPIICEYFIWDDTIDNFDTSNFVPYDLLMFKQTRERHNAYFYKRLSENKLGACYGGVPAIPFGNYNKYMAFIVRKINNFLHLFKYDRVRQWDSWRLWETWTAGSVAVHIDFEKYGCVLPVMPKNGVDYIGIDLENPNEIEKYLENNELLESIAQNGRRFVVENYAPKIIAQRLLNLLEKLH
jgi:hypothetical protein